MAPRADRARARSTSTSPGLIGPQIRAKVARGLARLPRSPQVRVARAILKRINEIYREEGELLAEIKALIEAHCPQLLVQHGCGTVTAAIIIGHTRRRPKVPDRRVLRPPRRHRTDSRQPRQYPTPPAAPRRRPPTKPCAAHHRALPRSHRSVDARVSRSPTQRRQDQARSDSLASSDTSHAASGACSTPRPKPPHPRTDPSLEKRKSGVSI